MQSLFKPYIFRSFSSLNSKLKIGFIGLGNMGGPMATNLVSKGHTVIAYDSIKSNYPQFAKKGLQMAENIQDMVPETKIIVTMLPNSQIVSSLCESTLFPKLSKGSIIIDSSTISPLVAKELSEKAKKHELSFVDAPVSGGVGGAQAGTLTFMVGTQEEKIFSQIQQVLQAMGKNIFKCGEAGTGQIAKMCNNLALAIQMVSICEALSLGKSLGMDVKVLTDVMKVSSARCWSIDTYNPVPGVMEGVPAGRNYDNGFACELMLKDLNIAKDVSEKVAKGSLLGNKTVEIYEEMVRKGYNKKDFGVLFEAFHKGEIKK